LLVGAKTNSKMKNFLGQLKGGDLRSIGKSDEVVKSVLKDPKLFKEVIEGMTDSDPLIRMRSADVAEKVSKLHPEYLQSFKKQLINEATKISQQEVRWHTAQMFSYLALAPKERDKVAKILFSWVETEKSSIARVMSLQTLANLAKQDRKIKIKVVALLRKFLEDSTPSLKSRSRKILKEFAAKEQNL
jgi:hypothetical protein